MINQKGTNSLVAQCQNFEQFYSPNQGNIKLTKIQDKKVGVLVPTQFNATHAFNRNDNL
jgi:hypothetical protein